MLINGVKKRSLLGFVGPGCSSIGVGAFCDYGPFKPSGEIFLKMIISGIKVTP
jgi:hypothetical protein